MKRSIQWLCLFVFIVIGYESKSQHADESMISEVVLVNGGDLDRCGMGQLINAISKCDPRIIGVDFLFVGEKDNTCDAELSQAIQASGKVVLIEELLDKGHIFSETKFTEPAMSACFSGILENKDSVADYYYRSDSSGYSFPFYLALHYDASRGSKLLAKSLEEDYPIMIGHHLNEFNLISPADVQNKAEMLKGKLVLIGFLGPGDAWQLETRLGNKSLVKTYETVIIANIILDILNDPDVKGEASDVKADNPGKKTLKKKSKGR